MTAYHYGKLLHNYCRYDLVLDTVKFSYQYVAMKVRQAVMYET